jgi:hypothetical protein
MKNKKTKLFLLFLLISSSLFSATPVKKIQIKKLFNLNSIMKKIKMSRERFTYPENKLFSKDEDGNFYLLNRYESRIIKLSKKGKLIKIIGHFGTDKLGLYYPKAIDIYNSVLYVLTSSARKTVLKGFDLNGNKLISSVEFAPKFTEAPCFMVEKDQFYVNLKTSSLKNSEEKLISVFNMKGKRMLSFGKPVKAQTWVGNIYFNMGIFSKYKDSIIGALWYYPIIVHYKTDGQMVYYKDLMKENFPKIKAIHKFVIRKNIDRPDKRYSVQNGQISYVNYLYAADIDKDLNLYYSTWELKENLRSSVLPVVYRFNKKGRHTDTLVLTLNGTPVRVCNLMFDRKTGERFGIGFIGSIVKKNLSIFVFKF